MFEINVIFIFEYETACNEIIYLNLKIVLLSNTDIIVRNHENSISYRGIA